MNRGRGLRRAPIPTQEGERHSPDSGATGGDLEEASLELTLTDLAGMFQTHMNQQEAREARQEQRFNSLKNQFQQLQLEVQAHAPRGPGAGDEPGPQAEVTVSPEASTDVATSGRFHFSPEPRLEK